MSFYDYTGNNRMASNGYVEYHRNTQDGHGGHAEEHREEMQKIAEQVVREVVREEVPRIAAEIYNQHITKLVGALEYDVHTVVNMAMDSAGDIFHSEKCEKAVSDQIVKQILADLGDLKI